MGGIDTVAVFFERRARRLQCLRGQLRSRETSAISASASDVHRAATVFRTEGTCSPSKEAFAHARSPSCAIAIPRSASADASSRSATRFSAPSGSPTASAAPRP